MAGNYGSCKIIFTILYLLFSLTLVSAFQFNGTVKDPEGNLLNNSLINITIRDISSFGIVGYNTTTTNASGWFNLSVSEGQWMYEPAITWTNVTTGAVKYIGQSLPAFPSQILAEVAGTTFFLKEAGTINITAINSTGHTISFRYQIKDQKLGYSISHNFDSATNQTVVTLPKDRNYSIMVFPDQSMPVSFDWNNLSSSLSYNLSNLSRYNVTTNTLHYKFNTTMNMVRVSGFINYSDIGGWDEFTIVPYLLEPGNMVHAGFGTMPYNLSSFIGGSDIHTLTNGFYNITLPSTPAETSNILLFATARNQSKYYGGIRNISALGSSGLTNFNFSFMSILVGASSNISMEKIDGGRANISAAKQAFNLFNSTNSTLTNINAHIETTVDYSRFGAIEFTWMSDIEQGENSTFRLPILNMTGIKEVNVYAGGGNYAPIRKEYTVSQLQNPVNISLNSFNPGAIDSALEASSITMVLYISNSTCDLPNPASVCLLGGSEQNMDTFNPMQSIIGGGKLSFRMGVGNISVHYVNVDMLASGPPDALFDSSTRESTGDSFESALRFGSGGPTIYDYVLISIPYTEGSSLRTGLDESSIINISIPILYDDSWNVIWNATVNGTSPTSLSGNNSHYSAKQSEWAYLLNQSTCGINQSNISASNPCFIDKTNNKIWIRLPHFSGTGPSVTGNVVTASSTSSPAASSSDSGSLGGAYWGNTYVEDKKEISEIGQVTKTLSVRQRIRLNVSGEQHHIGLVNVTENSATINVSSTPQQRTLFVGDKWKIDLDGKNSRYELLVTLNDITNNKANITIVAIEDRLPASTETAQTSDVAQEIQETPEEQFDKKTFFWWLILVVIVVVLAIVYKVRRKK